MLVNDLEEIGTCGCRLSPLLCGYRLKVLGGRDGVDGVQTFEDLVGRKSELLSGYRKVATHNPARE
jgi:hypothetical protein